jgi:DNA-binding response OmpR family regulator
VYLIHPTIGFVRKGGQDLKIVERILVVDDESDVCFMLQEVLRKDRFVVDSYKDPLLALSNFKAHCYNLVILDIRMPGLNGFALYREIRRLDKKVKICFLTAGEMYYGYAKCFIRKPIDNEELMKQINEIMIDDTTLCHETSDIVLSSD